MLKRRRACGRTTRAILRPHVSRTFRLQGNALQHHARSAVPVSQPVASRGVGAFALRGGGEEGLHRPDRRGRVRQDDALPEAPFRTRPEALRHGAHPESEAFGDATNQGDPDGAGRHGADAEPRGDDRPPEPAPARPGEGRARGGADHRRVAEPRLRDDRTPADAVEPRNRHAEAPANRPHRPAGTQNDAEGGASAPAPPARAGVLRPPPAFLSETRAYIRHRIREAAGRDRPEFSFFALLAIHRTSRGLPRDINKLCDKALLSAYVRDGKEVVYGDVRRARKESAL